MVVLIGEVVQLRVLLRFLPVSYAVLEVDGRKHHVDDDQLSCRGLERCIVVNARQLLRVSNSRKNLVRRLTSWRKEGLWRIGRKGETMRKYHSAYVKASDLEGKSTLSRCGLILRTDCKKAMTDLLYRGDPIGVPGGGSSMSGASKDVMSMVVPRMDKVVPLMELRGALSDEIPK
jgi:hypothetical protein